MQVFQGHNSVIFANLTTLRTDRRKAIFSFKWGLMLSQQYFTYIFITEPSYSMSPGGITSTNYFFESN